MFIRPLLLSGVLGGGKLVPNLFQTKSASKRDLKKFLRKYMTLNE